MDLQGQSVVYASYPRAATAGPGSLYIYSPGPGASNLEGGADFAADPALCVTVPVTLFETGIPDAGVADASEPID